MNETAETQAYLKEIHRPGFCKSVYANPARKDLGPHLLTIAAVVGLLVVAVVLV